MVEVGDRCEGMDRSQIVNDYFILDAEGDKHSESALTVTNVVDLFLSDSFDVCEGSREVVFGHVMESKVPEVED